MVDYEIHSVPMSMPLWRRKVERFLEANQLRLDEVDYYAIVTEPDGDEILAGGGLQGDIIKCIAVIFPSPGVCISESSFCPPSVFLQPIFCPRLPAGGKY